MSNSYQRIAYGIADSIATITLNRPEKRNALDDITLRELKQALSAVDADDSARVVILRGAGKDFCAGVDLAQLEKVAAGASRAENLADAMALGELLIQMRALRKPIVAAVHGNALAGGAGLATACDLIIAAESAFFGYPEVQLGFVPAMVMAILRRIVGEKVAFELAVLGERLSAAEAHRIGLVNRVCPDSKFDKDVERYTRELANRSAYAVQLIKQLVYGIDELSFSEAIKYGAEVNVQARMSEECISGVRRFLERQKRGG